MTAVKVRELLEQHFQVLAPIRQLVNRAESAFSILAGGGPVLDLPAGFGTRGVSRTGLALFLRARLQQPAGNLGKK